MEFDLMVIFSCNKVKNYKGKLKGTVDNSYAKLFLKVIDDYNSNQPFFDYRTRQKCDILHDFAQTYLMPWECWKVLYANRCLHFSRDLTYALLSMIPYHYHWDGNHLSSPYPEKVYPKLCNEFGDINSAVKAFLDMNSTLERGIRLKVGRRVALNSGLKIDGGILLENLMFPHIYLNYIWSLYNKSVASPPPKLIFTIVKKMKALQEELEAVESTEDENLWFNTLLKAENYSPDYLIQKTEYRIAKDLSNQTLWKLLILFLKKQNKHFKLLQIYSYYCRFYVDDSEMKREYEKAVKKCNGSDLFPVHWRNPFSFEKYDALACHLWYANQLYLPINDSSKKQICSVNFSTNGMVRQHFAFRSTILDYIANKDIKLKQKLYYTCKHFFARYGMLIIYKLFVDDKKEDDIFEESLQISNSIPVNIQKFSISTILSVYSSKSNTLSILIPQIYKCEAKYVDILGQTLTYKELNFLIGHGNVVDLTLDTGTDIFYENGNYVPFDKILKLTPKIEVFKIINIVNSPETSENLYDLQLNSKFIHIELSLIPTDLDPFSLTHFIINNASKKCYILLAYANQDYVEQHRFRLILQKELQKAWDTEDEPHISSNLNSIY